MELLSHCKASSPDPLHQEVIYKRPFAYQKMEGLIKEMQDPEHGVPVRSQKLFLTSIPAAFAGYDIIEWLMERLSIEDSVEAIHLANLLCQHGYFFPVGENRSLTVKDDSSLYRFQTPYYWPSQVPCLDNVDHAIYLAKRTLRNKQKHGLEDYEVEALNSLRKNLVQKWDFISMQADEQVRISKDRKKVDKMVTDSQERAFWRVLRPPPGTMSCVETPPMHMTDYQANKGVKQIRRTNLIEDLRAEVDLLRISCLRSRIKVSLALENLASHCEAYNEHDAFIVSRQPSNPWVTDDTTFWLLNAPMVEIPTERRVKKWGISMENLVYDPTGLREFTAYLKKEYCHENIRFWLAVRDMRFGVMSQLRVKAQEIYNEFLSPGAPCEINIDMRTMEAVQREMNYLTPSRFTFDPAGDHVYTMLLKKDCYPRFIRSEHYKSLLANAIQPNNPKKRFFSFAAPGKKKSSATNPLIFPVGSQSATAGVGEVVRAADEVILITTGNKTDFSASSQEVDRLSALSDTPYRGDMIPDTKRDNDSVRNTLSQSSFDDVCPWESMEKLPDKEGKASTIAHGVKGQGPGSLLGSMPMPTPTSLITPTLASQESSRLSRSATEFTKQESVTSTTGSLSLHFTTNKGHRLLESAEVPEDTLSVQDDHGILVLQKNKSSIVSPGSPGAVTLPAMSIPSGSMIPDEPLYSPQPPPPPPPSGQLPSASTDSSKDGGGGLPHPLIVPQSQSSLSLASPDNNNERRGQDQGQGQVKAGPTLLKSGSGSVDKDDEGELSLGNTQQKPTVLLTEPEIEKKSGTTTTTGDERLVDVCPWDHENGSQPPTTTFTKTYSTLGYL